MEYYKNHLQIYQTNLPNKLKIINFEKYRTIIQHDDYYLLDFPQNSYISLETLIQSICNKYILIYVGQAIIIINRILIHLEKLFNEIKITHGNLNKKNIFLSLSNTSQKFNIVQSKIDIEKIHFINYVQTDNINIKNDMLNIKESILELLSIYQSNRQICKLISEINQKSIQDVIKIIQQFQNSNVNLEKQQLNSEDLLQNFEYRIDYHMKIQEYYHLFYQIWKIDSSPDNQNKELQEISEMMKNLCQQHQIKIFQSSIMSILDNQLCNLEEIIEQILQSSQLYCQQLTKSLQKISTRIENQYLRMVQYQTQLNEEHNLQVQILPKSEIASIFYSSLQKEVVRAANYDLNRLEEMCDQIEKNLIKEIEYYQDLELKIVLLKVIQNFI